MTEREYSLLLFNSDQVQRLLEAAATYGFEVESLGDGNVCGVTQSRQLAVLRPLDNQAGRACDIETLQLIVHDADWWYENNSH